MGSCCGRNQGGTLSEIHAKLTTLSENLPKDLICCTFAIFKIRDTQNNLDLVTEISPSVDLSINVPVSLGNLGTASLLSNQESGMGLMSGTTSVRSGLGQGLGLGIGLGVSTGRNATGGGVRSGTTNAHGNGVATRNGNISGTGNETGTGTGIGLGMSINMSLGVGSIGGNGMGTGIGMGATQLSVGGNSSERRQLLISEDNKPDIQTKEIISSIRSLKVSTQRLVGILSHNATSRNDSNNEITNHIHVKGHSQTIFSCYFLGKHHLLVSYIKVLKEDSFVDLDYGDLDNTFDPYLKEILKLLSQLPTT